MFTYTAFEGHKLLSHGSLETIAVDIRKQLKARPEARILIFSDSSGKQMDLDLSGTEKETLERLKVFQANDTCQAQGPGRPKLGVVSREVSLLPQHWEWLSNQQGGASATLRRLVEEKIKQPLSSKDQVKKDQEVAFKFLTAIAGDLPNFEEAIRYLYRRDKKKFKDLIASWPGDLKTHTMRLTENVFDYRAAAGT